MPGQGQNSRRRWTALVGIAGTAAMAACGGSLSGDILDESAQLGEPLSTAASSIFFHGMGKAGLAEAAAYAYNPDLYALNPKEPFRPSVWSWGSYSAIGGYSAGRLPAMSYLQHRGSGVKYAFILDPSWDDRIDYGTNVILPWLRENPEHQMLVIVGPVSEGAILERYVGAVRGTPEWRRLTVCHTKDPHSEMRRYIPAIANPGFRVGRCE